MSWSVITHDAFDPEYDALPEIVQDELLAILRLLSLYGPRLGRPHVDTLAGSRYANMKELRFRAYGGVWRVAFAFDPERRAIVLVAGDKSGVAQQRFYKRLIATADLRFGHHLAALAAKEK
ncbi:type II toxin-antitoxin system RelE/ParE family toxin [Rhizorhabdus sp. FW153]|uniref:type II toxin-antitoxin system RelE/ParE family toxin n=1 Tax=Rhizorhabdus sp. FW153 TaxID=3400216 RepID=UPI003CE81767